MGWQTIIATIFQAGNRVVINPNGFFVYNGAPTLGNLVASSAPVGGVDSSGNAYKAGDAVYGPSGSIVNLATNGANASVIFTPAGATHLSTFPSVFSAATQAGLANEVEVLVLTSGKANGLDDAALQLFSESADGTIAGLAQIEFGGSVQFAVTKLLTTVGALTVDGVVTATGGSNSNPSLITTDSFVHITLDAGWSSLAGQPFPSVRLTTEGFIYAVGAIQFNANIANTPINSSVPASSVYRPASEIFIAGAPGSAGISIQTNGVFIAAQTPGQTTVFCNFNGHYPKNL